MTHEFKTPLSTIAISSEVLKDPAITQAPERLLNYATIIGQEASRLRAQVERVLQTASSGNEDLKLKKEELDLHELIRQVAEPFGLALAEKSGTLQISLQATRCLVPGDRLHIVNVLFNLLDNALKYNHNTPRISVATHNEKNRIHVSVADNGTGIAPEHLKQVFDRFYRVPTGNVHDVKGFGLGLNYVKSVVKAHGGNVRASSEPGKGSTFGFWLVCA